MKSMVWPLAAAMLLAACSQVPPRYFGPQLASASGEVEPQAISARYRDVSDSPERHFLPETERMHPGVAGRPGHPGHAAGIEEGVVVGGRGLRHRGRGERGPPTGSGAIGS